MGKINLIKTYSWIILVRILCSYYYLSYWFLDINNIERNYLVNVAKQFNSCATALGATKAEGTMALHLFSYAQLLSSRTEDGLHVTQT